MRSPCSQRKSLFRLIINNYFTTLIISSLSLALSLRPVSISPLLRRADALLVGELGGGLLRGGRGGGGVWPFFTREARKYCGFSDDEEREKGKAAFSDADEWLMVVAGGAGSGGAWASSFSGNPVDGVFGQLKEAGMRSLLYCEVAGGGAALLTLRLGRSSLLGVEEEQKL